MDYKLSRYEKNKDHDGNIVSIFVAISITDGEDGICQEHWLTEEEKDLVLADESNLSKILEEQASEGQMRLEKEVATRPQPTEFADEAKKELFTFSKTKIYDKVSALKALEADVEPTK